jgi:hypothetical protein
MPMGPRDRLLISNSKQMFGALELAISLKNEGS